MKLPKRLRLRESLASRISLWVVIYVVVIVGIAGLVGHYFFLKLVEEIQENGILHAISVRRISVLFVLLAIVTLVVLTNILRRMIHRLIAPLTAFTQAALEVAKGNLQTKLPDIKSIDEMFWLHRAFSTMQQSLVEQMKELKELNKAKGRLQGEMKAAREIQMSMLPKAYSHGDGKYPINICGQLIPALDVGGDLYDFFVTADKLFFCIGDVSGKGIPASLVMTKTLSQFRNVARYETDLGKLLQTINSTQCEGNDNFMFVTFFAGVLDMHTGCLQYCNAGHNKPYVVSSRTEAGNTVTTCEVLPSDPGLPLGVEDTTEYVVREYDMPPGAIMFLYTDGLTEAMTEQRAQFGSQRVEEVLSQGTDCKEVIEKMTDAVHQFVGNAPQSDDLTMLAVKLEKQE